MLFATVLAMFTVAMLGVAMLDAKKGSVWASLTVGYICLVAVYGVAWIAINHAMNMQAVFACTRFGQG